MLTSGFKLCVCVFLSGMLLRYFVNLYDMEIIEEEAFLAWKEDLSQEFPGKGKALFQVRTTCVSSPHVFSKALELDSKLRVCLCCR